jgi:hypothetical protein
MYRVTPIWELIVPGRSLVTTRLERLTHIDRTDVAQKRGGYRTVKRSSWSTVPSARRSSTRQSPARSLLIVLRLYVR